MSPSQFHEDNERDTGNTPGDIEDNTKETNENIAATAYTAQLRSDMHHKPPTSPPTNVLILIMIPFDTQAKAIYQKIDKVVNTVMLKGTKCPPRYKDVKNSKQITHNVPRHKRYH